MFDPVRTRYMAALERGMSIQAATAYANGGSEPVQPESAPEPVQPTEPVQPESGSSDDLDGMDKAALRARYLELNGGKKAYAGWDEIQLRERIRGLQSAE